MALDTATKRAASLHYARPNTAGIIPPTGTSSNVRRGNALGLYFGADSPSSNGNQKLQLSFVSAETAESTITCTTGGSTLTVRAIT